MSKAKAKGTQAENFLVNYLRSRFWPFAERRAQSGRNDTGDVTGTPNLVWEMKSGARLDVPGWLTETEQERARAGAEFGILVIKPKGLGEASVGRWWAILPMDQMTDLLRMAGFGGPRANRV